MAKIYKSTNRKLDVLLDIDEQPTSVEVLANRYDVKTKIIYDYIEWLRVRFTHIEKINGRYSASLSIEERNAYHTLRHPLIGFESRNVKSSFDKFFNTTKKRSIISLSDYENKELPNQSYSHPKYKSLFDELFHIELEEQ